MIENFTETSLFVVFLRKIKQRHYFIKGYLQSVLYKNSQTNNLVTACYEMLRIGFGCSFLERFTRVSLICNNQMLYTSKFISLLTAIYKKIKYSIARYLIASKIYGSVGESSKEFYIAPIKMGSLILIVAVLIDSILDMLLIRPMSLLDILARFALLFIGIGGLHSGVNWLGLCDTSLFMNSISKYCQRHN